MALPNNIPTRTSEDANSAADVNALMENCADLDDRLGGVGSYYTQYPAENTNTLADAFPESEEPASIYGGSWSETWGTSVDFANEGIFFKTRGDVLSQTDGENNVRTSGLQTDMMQGHYHDQRGYANDAVRGAGTYSLLNGTSDTTVDTGSPTANATDGTPRTGKETRGRNRFIKIWKRTA